MCDKAATRGHDLYAVAERYRRVCISVGLIPAGCCRRAASRCDLQGRCRTPIKTAAQQDRDRDLLIEGSAVVAAVTLFFILVGDVCGLKSCLLLHGRALPAVEVPGTGMDYFVQGTG